VGGPERRAERVAELDVVDAVIAAHEHEPQLVADDHRVGLDQGARGHAERLADLSHRGHPGRGLLDRCGQRLRQLDRLRRGAGHLDVRGVAGRQRDVVLARRTGRHVLVGAGAAHHPHVGLDPVPLEPATVEDAVVGVAVLVVAHVQSRRVAIEGVRVLHDELARPQHSGARPWLVAFLGLEVVEDQRQVAIRAHDLRDMRGDDLLVGHRQHHVCPAAVLQPEELAADRVVAPAALPQLGRVEHRHEHLVPADPVDLLTHDLHGLLVHPPAGRQPTPQPGADLPDHPGAHEQLVRERLRVGGRLFLGGEEVLAQTRHRRREA
jgi:hypothetical protein